MVRVGWAVVALVFGTSAFAGDWGKSDGGASWGKGSAEQIPVGKRLSVSEPVVVGDLALYPVVDRDARLSDRADVVPLATAMASGQVEIRETGNGVVSQLVMVNHGDVPVMVRAGDLVHGGMQDRVVQRTALVAATGVPVHLPVQCVERGRWTDPHGGTFAYAGRVDPLLREVVTRAASQDATWDAVARANTARGADPYGSWLAGRRLDPGQLARAERELRERFEDDKRVVGVIVARGGRFTGAEVYPDPTLFASDRMAVLGSHLSTPASAVASDHVPSVSDAAAFLDLEQGW